MKLSEAIRLGAMLRPQATGGMRTIPVRGWRGWLLNERVVGSCALAAAAEAIGLTAWIDTYDVWECLVFTKAICPVTREPGYLGGIVWRLNDEHGWTRERIAEWVTTVEKRDTEPAGQPDDVRGGQPQELPHLATRA